MSRYLVYKRNPAFFDSTIMFFSRQRLGQENGSSIYYLGK